MRPESARLAELRATADDPAEYVTADLAEAADALARVRAALGNGPIKDRVERAMSYVDAARKQHHGGAS